jgi:hypothetical protein
MKIRESTSNISPVMKLHHTFVGLLLDVLDWLGLGE